MPKAKLIAASVATKKKTSLSKRIFALVKKGVIYIVFLAVVASILLFVGVLYKRFEDIPPDDAPSSLPLREVMSASSVELQEPEGKRLLYMTASYGMEQFVFLQKSLDCMRDLCNMGWDVTLHLQVANGLNYSHPRFYEIQQQLYCIRTQAFIPLILAEYEKIGFGLNCKHRQYIAEHVDEFDYFVFAEEDMLLSVSHFAAFLASEQKLKKYLPKTWFRYFIGFLRYEDGIGGLNRVSWEYLPEKIHVVDMGSLLGKYVVTNNLNQAIYILSRFQIMDLEERCDFLSKPGNNDFYKALRRAMDMVGYTHTLIHSYTHTLIHSYTCSNISPMTRDDIAADLHSHHPQLDVSYPSYSSVTSPPVTSPTGSNVRV